MIKIWKGPEMEGTKVGIMTLFVCADVEVPIKHIIKYLQEDEGIRRVYFGAGKHSFEGVDDFKGLYDYLFSRSIEIVMEVSPTQLDDFVARYDTLITTFIVARYDMPYTFNNLQYKTDNNKVVTVFNAVSQTSLATLKENNLFTCDVMLMEEE